MEGCDFTSLQQQLEEKDKEIRKKDKEIREKDKEITELKRKHERERRGVRGRTKGVISDKTMTIIILMYIFLYFCTHMCHIILILPFRSRARQL